jgi:hypothetical protein
MATSTTDIQTTVNNYIADLNEAAQTRAFPPVIMKWFGPEGKLNFHNETHGRKGALQVWGHMLPTGEKVAREVTQVPYKVENGRVYSWRSLSGGNIPQPIYNLQETQFDDRTLISELHIMSADGKPDVQEDPEAQRSRLARIFVAFGATFNDFFASGDPNVFDEWLADDIKMIVDNNLKGMAIMAQYVRIAEGSKIELGDWEQTGDDQAKAMMHLTDRSGQLTKWKTEFNLGPEGKWREVNLVPERPMGLD